VNGSSHSRSVPPGSDQTTDSAESQWLAPEELAAGRLIWAESPRWRSGDLWVSDTQGSRLVVVGPDATRVFELASPVNGTGFLPSGDLVCAGMHTCRLNRFDGAEWTLYAELADLITGRLGDLIALPTGSVYVDEVQTPSDPGRLLMVDAGGRASVVAEDLVFPNGLAVIDNGDTLIVAETFAGRLTSFTIGRDGDLHHRRVWADLRAELGSEYLPDGIWPCQDGSVWVATTQGKALVRVANGRVVERIDLDGFAIACCLNDDASELFVTIASSLDPEVAVIDAVHKQRTRASVLRLRRRYANT
jgi:sugar lactone lactonase YvrE